MIVAIAIAALVVVFEGNSEELQIFLLVTEIK